MNDPFKIPSLRDLDCLITWPRGSVGEAQDMALLSRLLSLCEQHGFGRVPQLAAEIGEIWRDPAKREAFEQRKQKHLAFMDECRRATQP